MMIKCIGGHFDCQFMDIRDETRIGEPIVFPIRPYLTVAELMSMPMNDPPQVVTVKHVEYVLEQIRTPNIIIKFLRYRPLELETILLKVFQ